jgi:hypothetical protein
MFEIIDFTEHTRNHKTGGELPDHGAKIVLESTEMDNQHQALGVYSRDPRQGQ